RISSGNYYHRCQGKSKLFRNTFFNLLCVHRTHTARDEVDLNLSGHFVLVRHIEQGIQDRTNLLLACGSNRLAKNLDVICRCHGDLLTFHVAAFTKCYLLPSGLSASLLILGDLRLSPNSVVLLSVPFPVRGPAPAEAQFQVPSFWRQ